jgi:tRNA 2-thiouridine synthesizing protein A
MSDITPDEVVDLKGLNCPMPVLKTKKALDNAGGGKILRIDLTDAGSKSDIPAMVKRTGNELLEMTEADGVISFFIKKKEG